MSAPKGCPFHNAASAIADIASRNWQPVRPDGRRERAFHDKTQACLRGEFHVEPPADARFRQGLFAEQKSYPALVRFSSTLSLHDWLPDPRGLAIKLRGVDGEVCEGAPAGQQDFVLVNQKLFSFKDDEDVLVLFKKLDGRGRFTLTRGMAPSFVFPSFRPSAFRWYYIWSILETMWHHGRNRDLMRFVYYSMTPYRLGDGVVKYELHPEPGAFRRRGARGWTFMERLQTALNEGPAAFGFYVQPKLGEREAIEPTTVLWKTPLTRVGRLVIFPQDVAATIALGDALTFSPGNALRAHEPLGSVNEARRVAYRLSAEKRGASAVWPVEVK